MLRSAQPNERVCEVTGLQLVRSAGRTVHRIGRSKDGALNPLVRSGENRRSWGRWDTAAGRTRYAAQTAEGAFAEVLPYIKENLPEQPLSEFFEDVSPEELGQTLSSKVRAEMPAPTLRRAVTQGWRHQRTHYVYRLPPTGWFVDVTAAASVATIHNELEWDLKRLTLSELTADDRDITTSIAEWIRGLILDDGSRALGIRYISKHGSNLTAFGIWLRALDDGKNTSSEAVQASDERPIRKDDPDLVRVALRYNMTIH